MGAGNVGDNDGPSPDSLTYGSYALAAYWDGIGAYASKAFPGLTVGSVISKVGLVTSVTLTVPGVVAATIDDGLAAGAQVAAAGTFNVAGAYVGAEIGAWAGSFFPGPGNVIGGIVGGFAGGLSGLGIYGALTSLPDEAMLQASRETYFNNLVSRVENSYYAGKGLGTPREDVQSSNWTSGSSPQSGSGTGASSSDGTTTDHGDTPEDGETTPTGAGHTNLDASGGTLVPVIIDLSLSNDANNQSGDGLSFFGLHNSPVFYNADADGFKERTAWVGPTEGIVVYSEAASSQGLDINGDGTISAAEAASSGLDANQDGKITVAEIALTKVYDAKKASGQTSATTDMEALWKMEGEWAGANHDNKLTSTEATALKLYIWQDADMDGVIDSGEMKTFAQAGVSEIDMTESNLAELAQEGDGAKANQIVETRFSDGSVIFGTAKVTLTNGKETTAYDMGFAHEKAGMKEVKIDGTDFVAEVRLERQGAGAGVWNYLPATGSTSVDWDFDTAGKADYYGGTGTSGNDRMVYTGFLSRSFSGGAGADTLTGGSGDDFLVGGAGADRLRGGRGNDVLYIDADDVNSGVIDGGEGFDVAKVNSAAGVTINMTSTDIEAVYGSLGNDVISAGSRMIGVIMSGGAGNDRLTGGDDTDILIGGDGNDSIWGGTGDDQLIGGAGVDTMNGGDGDDYVLADENDNFAQIGGGGGFDILVIDDSVNTAAAFSQQLNLTAMNFEAAVGGEGNDAFNVSAFEKDTFLVGMGGNDTLKTGIGNDLLAGGKGNDTLDGGNGDDIYVFNREDGQDIIQETVGNTSVGGLDALAFGAKIRVDDLQFSLAGNDLLISLRAKDSTTLTGDTVRINNWGEINSGVANKQLELLAFSDGTILDIGGARFSSASGSTGLDIIDAGTGNNTIDALDGNDVVLGRAGNDNVHGSKGHDYLDGGLGNDTLFGDEDDDSLLGGQGDGSDKLDGGIGDDFLDGEDGADTLIGGNGKDELWGGRGVDTLDGGNGDDILVGGKNWDDLNGGLGDDVYFFGRGDGKDTIWDEGSDDDYEWEVVGTEQDAQGHSVPKYGKVYHQEYAENRLGDRIAFGFDIKLTDLAFDVTSTGDLRIGISRGGLIPNNIADLADLITVKNWTNEDKRIERLNFFDGAVLLVEGIDGASSGNNNNNVLDGGSGNNLLTGGGNTDTIRGHEGNDVLVGGAGDDNLYGQDGNDVIFGGNDNDLIKGGNGSDRLFGGAGNDDIYGNGEESGSDQGKEDYLVGGTGNDTLRGASGDDTYFFSFGDGSDTIIEESQSWQQGVTPEDDTRENTIQFGSGIWFSDLKVTGANDKLTMEIVPLNRPTESVTSITMNKFAIRQLEFANGYLAHFGDIFDGKWGTDVAETFDYSSQTKNGVWLSGNGGDDILKGGAGRDILIGGEENDTLNGGGDSDYYVFNAFDGRDVIWDAAGNSDSLAFGPGITLFDLSLKTVDGDLVISIRDDDRQDFSPVNAENSVTIKNWSENEGDKAHMEWFDFTIGNSFKIGDIGRAWFYGSENNNVTGTNASEWIETGTGSDTIDAGGGNDIVFGRDGVDTISGGDKNDQLYGEGGNDTLRGNTGHDQLYGGNGTDSLVGGDGSDYLYGGDGDDTLKSDKGSNLLNGGEGDDFIYRGGYLHVTYTSGANGGQPVALFDLKAEKPVRMVDKDNAVTVIEFAKGDGSDRVYVENPTDSQLTGKQDQIDLIGISMEEVWFQKSDDNLILKILGTRDQMVFVDYFKSDNYKFDRINADGQMLDHSEIFALMQEMNKYTPNDGNSNVGVTSSELADDLLDLIHDKWEKATWYTAPEAA